MVFLSLYIGRPSKTPLVGVQTKSAPLKSMVYIMAVRSLKLLGGGGGGQFEIQKGTLLLMMKGHISLKRKRAPRIFQMIISENSEKVLSVQCLIN